MEFWQDKRFKKIVKDPKYARIKSNVTKTHIDKRFQAVFNDKEFQFQGGFDKYGNHIGAKQDESYRRLYKLKHDCKNLKKEKNVLNGSKKINLNSKEFLIETSSNESELWSEEEIVEPKLFKKPFEDETTEDGDTFKRLALVNMDWDQIRATDVFIIINSFLPEGGSVREVIIYPTDYGNRHLRVKKTAGFSGIRQLVLEENNLDTFEKTKINADNIQEELRYYELLKMRYYFALIICDSKETALILYKQLDGLEFEHSANQLDLRFVNDKWKAKYPIRDRCSTFLNQYIAPEFFTKAVQHTKVTDTWDEDPKYREHFFRKTIEAEDHNLNDDELKTYLASEESDNEGSDFAGEYTKENISLKKKARSAFSNLLEELKRQENEFSKKKKKNITFSSELSLTAEDKILKAREKILEENEISWERKNKDPLSYDKEIKNSINSSPKEIEEIEKKVPSKIEIKKIKNKKAKLDLLFMNYKKKKVSNFKVNTNDSRLQEIYDNSEFTIDPTNPNYRKNSHSYKFYEKSKTPKKKLEQNTLSSLVETVKLKSNSFMGYKKDNLK